jgi:hypothetical protein
MHLAFAFLANNAEIATGGRLHVFGGDFNVVRVASLPTIITVAFVAKLRCTRDEIGSKHTAKIELRRPNSDWEPIEGGEVPITVPESIVPELEPGVGLLTNITIQLNEVGRHEVGFSVDGISYATVPLAVGVKEATTQAT